MYLGEASVKESHLSSVMKTAECLRVKGLAILENDFFHKAATSSNVSNPAPANTVNSNINSTTTTATTVEDLQRPTKRRKKPEPSRCFPLHKTVVSHPVTVPTGSINNSQQQLVALQQTNPPITTTISTDLPPPAVPAARVPTVSSISSCHTLSSQPLQRQHTQQPSPRSTSIPSPFMISPSASPSHTPPLYIVSPANSTSNNTPSTLSNQTTHTFTTIQSVDSIGQSQDISLVQSILKDDQQASHRVPKNLNQQNASSTPVALTETRILSQQEKQSSVTSVSRDNVLTAITTNQDDGSMIEVKDEPAIDNLENTSTSEDIPTISGLVGIDNKIMKEDILLENSDDVKAQMGITTGADGCVGIPELLDGLVDIRPLYNSKNNQSEELESLKSNVSIFL